ncbi:MAG: class B sortase, partial [Oscillospiraceae bacterium]|nr:class B sortase [Oscillospiraceae bacterium]
MKMKKTIIMAAVSVALLFGGTTLLLKDDAQQAQKNAEIKPYALTQDMQEKLDEIADELTAETIQESIPEIADLTETTEFSEMTEQENSTQTVDRSGTLPAEILQQLKNAASMLTEAYPDAVGWLYLPDTNINYPLMQGEDNAFYLHHAYDGSSLSAGSVFLDYRCEPRLLNPINVVYAHNMKNGSMFAGPLKFGDSAYFDSHRYGWLATSDTVYRIDFFSLAKANYHDPIYDGSQPIYDWISQIQNLSVICKEISYDACDRFISLSTCSNEFANARTVLTGKL